MIAALGMSVALRESWSRHAALGSRFRNIRGAFGQPSAPTGKDVMHLITRLRQRLRGTAGQDLLEYALLVALIALVCVAVITSTGTNVQGIFTKISAELATANK
jgi:Flp pilus assembly pilin Flp